MVADILHAFDEAFLVELSFKLELPGARAVGGRRVRRALEHGQGPHSKIEQLLP